MKKLLFAMTTAAVLSIGAWSQAAAPAPTAPATSPGDRHEDRVEHRHHRRVHHRHARRAHRRHRAA